MVERRLSVWLVSLFLLPLVPLGDEMTDMDAPDVVQWTSDEAASHWSIGGSPVLEKSSLRATTGCLLYTSPSQRASRAARMPT